MKIKLLLYSCILMICFGCKSYKTKYPYSLEDFRPELRGDLQKIIQTGIVGEYYFKKFEENCTVSDLNKMFKSEHPLIRAKAFYLLTKKDSNNVKEILLSSLDDTAVIFVDHGEWGIKNMYCSDYYIDEFQSARFESKKNRIKQIELLEILLNKAPYLQNTYQIMANIDTIPEKYYQPILNLTVESEYPNHVAIYALSKFKKLSDVSHIKKHLTNYNEYIWKIIQNNPAPEYFEVLIDFFERLVNDNKYGSGAFQAMITKHGISKKINDFICTLSKYKNKESADMFLKIYKEKMYPILGNNRQNQFECYLYDLLVTERCYDYESIISTLKPFAEKYKKVYDLPLNQSTFHYENISR